MSCLVLTYLACCPLAAVLILLSHANTSFLGTELLAASFDYGLILIIIYSYVISPCNHGFAAPLMAPSIDFDQLWTIH